jgi:hypothetical protein
VPLRIITAGRLPSGWVSLKRVFFVREWWIRDHFVEQVVYGLLASEWQD